METNDDDNKGGEGEKRCFDLFATLVSAFGNDETRAKRSQEEQERNMLMINTITSAATKTFLCPKLKIDQQNIASSSTSSLSLVESNQPIRAQPIIRMKPPKVRERKGPVKQKEPVVRREPGVTPGWLVELMRKHKGVNAKLVIEKLITKTDLNPVQARFLIPFKQILEDFLNGAELNILEKHHKEDAHHKVDVKKGVDVIFLSSNHEEERQWEANMRIWEMTENFNYALCAGWNKFVRENDLVVNQTRRLWSFHSLDGKLYLVFAPVPDVAQPHGLAHPVAQPPDQDQDEAMAL